MYLKQLHNFFIIFVLLLGFSTLNGCTNQDPPEPVKKELLIYCGTAMVKPMREIADRIEKQENCIIKIIINGSGTLYHSIKINQKGDLYLPGIESYIEKFRQEKLVTETVPVGFNRAVLVVAKGNPLNIPGHLNSLLNPDYRIVLGTPDSGSIGRATKTILTHAGIYDQVITQTISLTMDAADLIKVITNNKADLVINWHATTTWPKNRELMDALLLDEGVVSRHKLTLGLLSFSRQPEIARRFMELASSPEGREIFADYGFGGDR
ncbi:MAG: substrate-binding domain-containing protein [Pseudomonadota bacterium]|nr:substrate-binding domain-containing protein [Pseudomonadota bacterium]